jgi:myosin heavy subunit
VEGIRISRAAYPNRVSFTDLVQRFRLIKPASAPIGRQGAFTITREEAGRFLASLVDTPGGFELGKTRVYFRTGVLEVLEDARTAAVLAAVVHAQRIVRGWRIRRCVLGDDVVRPDEREEGLVIHVVEEWCETDGLFLARAAHLLYVMTTAAADPVCGGLGRRYEAIGRACLAAQSLRRGAVVRRAYVALRCAVIALQCRLRRLRACRALESLRKEAAAVALQAWARGVRGRRRFSATRSAMVRVQAWVRRVMARARFLVLLAEAKEQAKLENQIESLKKRLEEVGQSSWGMGARVGGTMPA